MTATCGTSHPTEAGESREEADKGRTHLFFDLLQASFSPPPLFCGGLAPRRRAPEQCSLRDRPAPTTLIVSGPAAEHPGARRALSQGCGHATPPSQPAAHACMDQACKQVHAICSQRSDFFEAGCLGSIDPTCQILMSNPSYGSRRIFVWLASSLYRPKSPQIAQNQSKTDWNGLVLPQGRRPSHMF